MPTPARVLQPTGLREQHARARRILRDPETAEKTGRQRGALLAFTRTASVPERDELCAGRPRRPLVGRGWTRCEPNALGRDFPGRSLASLSPRLGATFGVALRNLRGFRRFGRLCASAGRRPGGWHGRRIALQWSTERPLVHTGAPETGRGQGDPYNRCAMRISTTAAAAHLVTLLLGAAAFALPIPKGGCPQPEHTLVVAEFQVGAGSKPRWLEIVNPGKSAVALDNVVVRIKAKDISKGQGVASDVLEFTIAEKIASLPAGEPLLIGHLPETPGVKGPYYGLKLIDLGPIFQLPLCEVTIEVIGPGSIGSIDTVAYDLCKGSANPEESLWQTVMALDPGHMDICKNDQLTTWCVPTAKASLTEPSPGKANPWCDLDNDGYTQTTGDCDDASNAINPDANEVCNGLDDDCNGKTDDDVVVPPGVCLSLGICSLPRKDGSPVAQCQGAGGFTCSYREGYQAANETACDGIDNDCDGGTDEGKLNACGNCGAPPIEVCNGVDDDCDGQTDEDLDLSHHDCGVGECALAAPICAGQGGLQCQMPATWQATETRCDQLDNDCDGVTDEELGLGNACAIGVGACEGIGKWTCGANSARVCAAKVGAPAAEICGDARDNDCDGQTDEGFNVGAQCTVGLGACAVVGKTVCDADDPGRSLCHAKPKAPATSETCGNGIDDDCDGLTDEPSCRKSDDSQGSGCSSSPVPAAGGENGLGLLLFGLILWACSRRGAASIAAE